MKLFTWKALFLMYKSFLWKFDCSLKNTIVAYGGPIWCCHLQELEKSYLLISFPILFLVLLWLLLLWQSLLFILQALLPTIVSFVSF